jgi:hypothetical protein
MKKTATLILGLLVALAGCGDDDADPTGPAAIVTDQITVALDDITITRDCDPGGGGPGEFGYKFYIVLFENGTEIGRELDDDWGSFAADDFTSWDPSATATFTLERREDVQFNVRLQIRELDSVEQFSQGAFVPHINGGNPAWRPGPNGTVTEYTLYDSGQERGIIDWEWRFSDDCFGSFQYSVTVERAPE